MVKEIITSVEFIYCECKCQKTRPKYNKDGSEGKFIHNHNIRCQRPSPRFGKEAANYKGGRRKNYHGYILILKSDHPYAQKGGYVKENRLVYEEYMTQKWGIRFIIHPSIECHHINEIKDDNRIENLRLMTKSDHTILHQKIHNGNTLCAICNKMTWIRKSGKRKGREEWRLHPNDKSLHICIYCHEKLRRRNIV